MRGAQVDAASTADASKLRGVRATTTSKKPRPRGPDKEYIASLKTAIKSLEQKASQLGVPVKHGDKDGKNVKRSRTLSEDEMKTEANLPLSPPRTGLLKQDDKQALVVLAQNLNLAYQSPSRTPSPECYLSQTIFNNHRHQLNEGIMKAIQHQRFPEPSHSPTSPDLAAIGLPRDVLDILISVYFETTGAMVPLNFIHPGFFNIESTHPLLLLAMCAHASRFAVARGYENVARAIEYDPESGMTPGDLFFYKARRLALECFDQGVTLEILQATLLLSLYCCGLMATSLTCMAASAAQDLGINNVESMEHNEVATIESAKATFTRSLVSVILWDQVKSTSGAVPPLLSTDSSCHQLRVIDAEETSWWKQNPAFPVGPPVSAVSPKSAKPNPPSLLERFVIVLSSFRRAAGFAIMARLLPQGIPSAETSEYVQSIAEMDGFLDAQMFELRPVSYCIAQGAETISVRSERFGEVTLRLFLYGARVALHLLRFVAGVEAESKPDLFDRELVQNWQWSFKKAWDSVVEFSELLEVAIIKDDNDDILLWAPVALSFYHNAIFLLFILSKLTSTDKCISLQSLPGLTIDKINIHLQRHKKWWKCAGFYYDMLNLLEAGVRDGSEFSGIAFACLAF
ncbi:hypothetical protein BC829DRAFT_406410 [Chytridium lagenaria]|nr:hypothetical protein BC829DRAFT_406410 [Chytridium lagenaria]